MKILGKIKEIALLGAVTIGAYTPNYTTGDMDEIFADLLGTAGVESKSYMSLFILGLAMLVIVGVGVKIKDAF